MDETLKQIITKLDSIDNKVDDVSRELKEFRESQGVINKLLTSDSVGIKNQLRDVQEEIYGVP
ncbi:hypothetical protein [Paenibacillus macerans]|uniref:hypothetical protein n=1 Tax=Paenibacillus macerans TaxID=44252 RepID=UPI0022E4DC0B|nr:hypothetical protein [Paenibacillus macerans]